MTSEESYAFHVECPRCKAKPEQLCDMIGNGSEEDNADLNMICIHPARISKATLDPDKGHYIMTISGKRIYLTCPDPKLIDIHDISHGLSQINRFHGQTRYPYSVAEHSIIVASMMPPYREYQLAALLHDAVEAYTGDIVQPVKRLLNGASFEAIDHLEDMLMKVILGGLLGHDRFFPAAIWEEVAKADRRVAAHEMEYHCGPGFYDPIMDTELRYLPHQLQLQEPLSPVSAKFEFLMCYSALMTSWGQHISDLTGHRVLFRGPSGMRI